MTATPAEIAEQQFGDGYTLVPDTDERREAYSSELADMIRTLEASPPSEVKLYVLRGSTAERFPA